MKKEIEANLNRCVSSVMLRVARQVFLMFLKETQIYFMSLVLLKLT